MERGRRRSSGAGRLVTTVVVAAVLVVAAAFGVIDVDDLRNILLGSGEQGTVQGAGDPSEARDVLRELEVAPPGSMAGYSREKFPTGAMRRSSGGMSRTPRVTPATSPSSETARTSG